jgi:VIT1/CCC1 family predicted Fe2+/Mn2+ transporter
MPLTKQQHSLIDEHLPEAIKRRLRHNTSSRSRSSATLGGIDGCITTFAIVSGAAGAGLSAPIALVLGFANLLADGFSMAVSQYESIKTENAVIDSVREHEARHIEQIPQGEREEVRQIFQQKGFNGDTLETIVNTISGDKRLWIDTMLREEHGLQPGANNALLPASITFIAFILMGALPLIPFMFSTLQMPQQFMLSSVIAALVFFCIGLLKSPATDKPRLGAGFSTLLTGGSAAALAYATGHILREVFGIL